MPTARRSPCGPTRRASEPGEIVERFHPAFLETWDRLGISFDLFTTTQTDTHRRGRPGAVRAPPRQRLHPPGDHRAALRRASRALPARPLRRGDVPALRLPAGPRRPVRELRTDARRRGPDRPEEPPHRHDADAASRPSTGSSPCRSSPIRCSAGCASARAGARHVINWTLQFVEDGLLDRAITRDLAWGVPLPDDAAIGEGKRIYVWFEAVIGYLSASQEWAERSGRPRRLEALLAGPRGRVVLLHRQGQHPLPHGDLAGDAARRRRPQPADRRPRQPVRHVRRRQGVEVGWRRALRPRVPRRAAARRAALRGGIGAARAERHRAHRRRDRRAASTTSWSPRGATSSTACWR